MTHEGRRRTAEPNDSPKLVGAIDTDAFVDDPFVRRIPPDWPRAFLRLPPDEVGWRARCCLLVWIATGSLPFAWSVALNGDPVISAENRAYVEELGDELIERSLNAAR